MGEKLKGKKLNISFDKEVLNKKNAVERGAISFEGSPRAGEREQQKVGQNEKKVKIKSRKLKSENKESLKFEENNFKIRKRKISSKGLKNDTYDEVLDKEEAIADEKIENEETLSVAVVVVILLICFLVGILLGYLLYHIAINSSNALLIIQNLF